MCLGPSSPQPEDTIERRARAAAALLTIRPSDVPRHRPFLGPDDGDDLLSDLRLFYCDTATFGESAPNVQQVCALVYGDDAMHAML